jgi:hypothetical protein
VTPKPSWVGPTVSLIWVPNPVPGPVGFGTPRVFLRHEVSGGSRASTPVFLVLPGFRARLLLGFLLGPELAEGGGIGVQTLQTDLPGSPWLH